ncbi:aspartate kinase [Priestia endophytica]|jgi:aspartate kinase|uniref:aspartate kinase n=1 Tax=Priestia endophytica TaxID=135735 RepID=UPI000DCA75F6|nr:aspartate kinase [Priestia endophytica]MED4069820.1 aspartate kinase [Priestia endophytica]RAS80153.1 aspartate kinase [Priestia endophytica]
MKVAKFGGSSVASAEKFMKVADIVMADQERRIVVVSAPGKRFKDDIKMTDLLIALTSQILTGNSYAEEFKAIIVRYKEIADGLKLKSYICDEIAENLQDIIDTYKEDANRLLDSVKASGEDNNARLMAFYLQSLGLKAQYVNPKEAGIFVTDEPGNAQVLEQSYRELANLREREEILVIPGFFGYSEQGNIVTFPRGGSDITGSIVAAGVKATMYENFTDVDSIVCVNPTIVEKPKDIKEITYREMRELSYAGFSVFHDEALHPVVSQKIPVCVKNTNNPQAPGTLIVAERDYSKQQVAGIASDEGFCSIYVSKYLMNREIGFGRRLLQILEDEQISYEHTPSGIDDMSIILRKCQLTNGKEERVLERIQKELNVDDVKVQYGLALIMVVGEGMTSSVGVAAKATNAFSEAGVNLELINQGSSEVSMMFGVKETELNKAVQSLYKAYFEQPVSALTL